MAEEQGAGIMPPRTSRNQRNPVKIIVLLTLLTLITSLTSVSLSVYPQHLFVDNKTSIGTVQFTGNQTAIVKGNQVSYSANQIIPLEGRSYIKLTGRQVQLSGNRYEEGIRTVFAEWNQNLLLQQQIGEFSVNSIAQIGIDTTIINLIPISQDVLNVNAFDITKKAPASNYNLQLVQNTVYLSEGGAMVKLEKNGDKITVSLIGSGYKNIWMRVI